MAGDWIKVELVTPDKPEVHQIAQILKATPNEVLGCLVRVWIWADQQSLNGHALGVTLSTLDGVSRRDGLGSAMLQVGWVIEKSGVLSLPNFDRHNGETAKKRALAAKRQQTHRSQKSNADSVTQALPEKRREYITPIVPKPEWLPIETWGEFVKMRKAGKGKFTPHAEKLLLSELGRLVGEGQDAKAVLEQSIVNGWKSVFPVKAKSSGVRAIDEAFAGAVQG